jgi:hypothetical protein
MMTSKLIGLVRRSLSLSLAGQRIDSKHQPRTTSRVVVGPAFHQIVPLYQ